MEPALKSGATIICRKAPRSIRRGTLVVLTHPSSGLTLVKRVVGLPGESITIDLGDVVIDGKPGLDLWGTAPTFPEGLWNLGNDEVFVLSDNRSATTDDSRRFGGVPTRNLLSVFWRIQ
jgi:signal peptidase I